MRLSLLLLPVISSACLLCPLRFPSLNNVNLPPIDTLFNIDHLLGLCENSSSLPVTEECRDAIGQLSCSVSGLMEGLSSTCPGMDKMEQCEKCQTRLAQLSNGNMWTLKWLDAVGKMPSGINEGNRFMLGDFDQCTQLRRSGDFLGRYCRLSIHLSSNCNQSSSPFQLGICAPLDCSPIELLRVVEQLIPFSSNELLRIVGQLIPLQLNIQCDESEEYWPLSSVIIVCLLCIWLAIIVCCTILNGILVDGNDRLLRICRQSSLLVNGQRALSTRRSPSSSLHHGDGLIVISLVFWLIASTYGFMVETTANPLFVFELRHSIINNTSFLLDGILLVFALNCSISLLHYVHSLQKLRRFLVNRLLWILPVMVMWLIIVTGILKQLANGPLWFNSGMINRCKKGWWTNLLFINNLFYSAEDNCLDGSWLISLMVQFTFLLIPGVMLMLWSRLMARIVGVFVLAASMLYTFLMVMHNHLPPTLLMVPYMYSSEQMTGYLNLIYIPPWTRLAPILIGLIAAPFFQQGQKTVNNTLTRGFRWLLWLCWLSAAMMVMFGLNVSSTETWSACYSAIHRPLWSMAMVILLYLCHLDCAGEVIGSLLEWRLFAPGARLSLGVLLAWEPVAVYVFGCQHRETYASHWSTLYSSISVISISYLIAFLIDVLFQRPVRRLIVPLLHQDDQHQLNHQK